MLHVVRRIDVTGNTRTKTEVIRRELLFEPGDTLTASLIEETERNLRALLFLGDVLVHVKPSGEVADVEVRVRDLYSRAVTPLLSGEIDELNYGAVGLDYNFLGQGQIVEMTAEHRSVTGNRVRAFFREPRVGGSRIRVDLGGEVASEGHHALVRISRPFFRLSERWSAAGTVLSQESITRLYSGQTIVEKYVSEEVGGSLSLSRSYGSDVKIRPGVSLSVSDRQFSPESGYNYAPGDRRRVLPSVGLTIWWPQFEKTQFFQHLGQTEDLQTRSWISVRAGASLEALGSDCDYRFLIVDANPRSKISPTSYLLMRFRLRSRFSQGYTWNILGSAEAKLLVKVRDVHAVAARVRCDGLGRVEDTTQFLLGPARGLRGYALRRFDGSRRVFFNIEGRPTLLRKRDFTLAGVVFVDGGSAWTPGVGSRSLAVSVGVGGRVGMTRVYNSPILRADVGYGFEDRTWVLYMGLGQYF